MLTAVVGVQWGDEGKGRMVDLFAENADFVVRYQGGNNAGHTVVNPLGEFKLNLLPSGIFHKGTVGVMGGGMVIDLCHLCGEIERVRAAGVEITPQNLMISDRATIVLPYHIQQDILEEERLTALTGKAYGSTRRGIAPVYGDKYLKKSLRMSDLLCPNSLQAAVAGLVEWKNLLLERGYGTAPICEQDILEYLTKYGQQIVPFLRDTDKILEQAQKHDKNILFEAQLGALRDIDFGIYPYTSSSSTIAAYAPIGSGIPGCKLDRCIGIMKAYSTCVGEGPFTAELTGSEADRLRDVGKEYGAATGRPRRVGAFDVPASRYGAKIQGAQEIALTKLDVLSYLERIPVCTQYSIQGVQTQEFPHGDRLLAAKPVMEYLDGWQCDISTCRTYRDLPQKAKNYVSYLEQAVQCKIKYISVGANREAYIEIDG